MTQKHLPADRVRQAARIRQASAYHVLEVGVNVQTLPKVSMAALEGLATT